MSRVGIRVVPVAFWLTLCASTGFLALSGHCMNARWHVGPVCGSSYWWVLITSPEILIFLFFMITDPKTAPIDDPARLVYGVTVGVLAAVFAGSQNSEFGTKVAVLAALTVVCASRPLLEREGVAGWLRARPHSRSQMLVAIGLVFVGTAGILGVGTVSRAEPPSASALPSSNNRGQVLPRITIEPTVRQAGADVTEAVARLMVANVMDVAKVSGGPRAELAQATVTLVRDPTQPQASPQIGVRIEGHSSDGPYNRTFTVTPAGDHYSVSG